MIVAHYYYYHCCVTTIAYRDRYFMAAKHHPFVEPGNDVDPSEVTEALCRGVRPTFPTDVTIPRALQVRR